jgi:hypothetical protein
MQMNSNQEIISLTLGSSDLGLRLRMLSSFSIGILLITCIERKRVKYKLIAKCSEDIPSLLFLQPFQAFLGLPSDPEI